MAIRLRIWNYLFTSWFCALVYALVIMGLFLTLFILGCASSSRSQIVSMENQIGSKLELKSVVRTDGFEEIQIPNPVRDGLGYTIARLNSNEFMHERYYQFNFREPAQSPFEWQMNAKVKSYILGKYGVLP